MDSFYAGRLHPIPPINTGMNFDITIPISSRASDRSFLQQDFEDVEELRITDHPDNTSKAIEKYSKMTETELEYMMKKKGDNRCAILNKLSDLFRKAWRIPCRQHKLANALCNAVRQCKGVAWLVANCDCQRSDIKLPSGELLSLCLNESNARFILENYLTEVQLACVSMSECPRIYAALLEALFKIDEGMNNSLMKFGCLDALMEACQHGDVETVRHGVKALANLALYGSTSNQRKLQKVLLTDFHSKYDDNYIKYYYFFTSYALAVSLEDIKPDIKVSSDAVVKFISSLNPVDFVESNYDHSESWLKRLLPMFNSQHQAARSLAVFHYAVEASNKTCRCDIDTRMFHRIGAIDALKGIAASHNESFVTMGLAGHALISLQECQPREYIVRRIDVDYDEGSKRTAWMVPVWGEEALVDGFCERLTNIFDMPAVRGEGSNNTYISSTRSSNVSDLSRNRVTLGEVPPNDGIQQIKTDFSQSHSLPQATNTTLTPTYRHKPTDIFISYRRDDGSFLASLIRDGLRNKFSVFMDVNELYAGRFDENLLRSIGEAKTFVLILTAGALDRCVGDEECQDWIHKEIKAAMEYACKIIPVTTKKFVWPPPQTLPADMRNIGLFNAVEWSHEYQSSSMEKLRKFITKSIEELNKYQPRLNFDHILTF